MSLEEKCTSLEKSENKMDANMKELELSLIEMTLAHEEVVSGKQNVEVKLRKFQKYVLGARGEGFSQAILQTTFFLQNCY